MRCLSPVGLPQFLQGLLTTSVPDHEYYERGNTQYQNKRQIVPVTALELHRTLMAMSTAQTAVTQLAIVFKVMCSMVSPLVEKVETSGKLSPVIGISTSRSIACLGIQLP
jgi:hypothetical protein